MAQETETGTSFQPNFLDKTVWVLTKRLCPYSCVKVLAQ
jgi:hypothetical protein